MNSTEMLVNRITKILVPTPGEIEAWKNGAEAERLRCARIAKEYGRTAICAWGCSLEIEEKIRSGE